MRELSKCPLAMRLSTHCAAGAGMDPIPTWAWLGVLAFALALAAQPALAQAPGAAAGDRLPDAYARVGDGISFFDTPNRRHTTINEGEPVVLGKVSVALKRPAELLVQFTSGIATVTPEGCPCSVRASIKVDDQAAIVIKRINLGAATAQVAGKYQPDRQSADGSYVLSLAPGRHDIAVIVQRVEGSSKTLQAFYINIQALSFPSLSAGRP
jgi:hypothetical protein